MQVGWIGLGVMGSSMVGHLLRAGHCVTVHTRTRSKAEPLLGLGAVLADSARDASEGAEIVCSMVGLPSEIEAVHLGEFGTLSASHPAPVLIDFSTAPAELARRIAVEARKRHVLALDAPVSGGDVGARNATLSIMVGGDESAVATALPIFNAVGKKVVHQGSAGTGQSTKAVNQILVAASCVGMAEALLFAQRSGLDLVKVIETVGAGAAGSWTLSNLAPRVLRGDESPGFQVNHLVKDLEIVMEEAHRMGSVLEATALAHRLYKALQASGGGEKGTQAICPFLAKGALGTIPIIHNP
ncbi:MAG: NAD(P)-dependent oxidoreductase [Planctomycetota bacterium]|nr:NAD(P)-dependent oxidoreductase [Planctomycetota bacterium]